METKAKEEMSTQWPRASSVVAFPAVTLKARSESMVGGPAQVRAGNVRTGQSPLLQGWPAKQAPRREKHNRKLAIGQKRQREEQGEGGQRAREGSLEGQEDRRTLGQADRGPSPGPRGLSGPSAMHICERLTKGQRGLSWQPPAQLFTRFGLLSSYHLLKFIPPPATDYEELRSLRPILFVLRCKRALHPTP